MNTQIIRRAAIMSRVSSDEQAKGYSLNVQEEALSKHCEKNGIEIVYTFKEDHSAKTFERPAFKQFLAHIKKNRGTIDILLFTSWDRFSRNITESLLMIRKLHSMGIVPHAIEQPLDMSVPENKMMLAMYLTLPEIDNDRRSIKVRGGMRAAAKAGRYPNSAPVGYRNARDENNKPVIIPDENAELMRFAFHAFSNGMRQTDIKDTLSTKGLRIIASNLSKQLRNPVYMGKIKVKAEGSEPEMLVDGLHEPLVSQNTFERVQQLLENNRTNKNRPSVTKRKDELPLRGLLSCPECGENMTGSASRGKLGQRYHYYHCNRCHKSRFRAEAANASIESILDELKFSPKVSEIFESIVREKLNISKHQKAKQNTANESKLHVLKERIHKLQDMLLDGKISGEDYAQMRSRLNNELKEMTAQNSVDPKESQEIGSSIKKCIQVLENLPQLYRDADTEKKQRLLGSIFPEKITFDGKKCRTPRLNSVLLLSLAPDKGFRKIKRGQLNQKLELSSKVARRGIEPLLPE